MEKEKIGNNELKALGINDVEVLVNFSRVANGLLKHGVMDKTNILFNLAALIDDPLPYALKKGGKFKNLAEDVIAMRKEGKFVKQERSNFKLKEEIADFPVWGLENIEVGAVSKENHNEVAAHYGHTSGDKLYQRYNWYASAANRKATEDTPKKLLNKIKRFEAAVPPRHGKTAAQNFG